MLVYVHVRVVVHSLDSISQNNESNQHPYCPIQVPHCRVVAKNLSTDEDGEPHHSPNQGVEPCKKQDKRQGKIQWSQGCVFPSQEES